MNHLCAERYLVEHETSLLSKTLLRGLKRLQCLSVVGAYVLGAANQTTKLTKAARNFSVVKSEVAYKCVTFVLKYTKIALGYEAGTRERKWMFPHDRMIS